MASNDPTVEQWAATVLKRLRIRQTPGAVQALVGWARAEGGHWNNQARYNPLNTTQPEPGAGNTGSQGNIKVYRSWDQGIDATVKTLENGRYQPILQGLASGDPNRVANAIGQTPWGTSGGLVKRTIAGTKPISGVQPYQGSSQPSSPGGGYQSVTTSTPGVDNSQQRKLAVMGFLQQGGVKNPGAVGQLAATYGNLADVPGTTSTSQVAPSARGSGNPHVDSTVDQLKQQMETIDDARVPYLWGGGHQGRQVSPGAKVTPLDCSGAVSRALGIDPRVASQFKQWGNGGRGKRVTVWANDGHVLMEVDGHFWGTSRTNPGGGAGWIPRSAISDSYLKNFTPRHPPGA